MDSQAPLLIDTGRGFSVLYNKRYLYSPIDPERRASLRAESTQLQADTLYILTSPLLFYGVSGIVSNLPLGSHVICFEFSEPLYELSKRNLPEAVLDTKSITFIDSTNPQDIFNAIKNLGIWNFRRVKAINISGGYSLYTTEYKNIIDVINSNIQKYWKNHITLIHMAPLWIRNIFLNLYKTNMNKGILTINTFPSIECPILVTGAGESLEGSINFIKENKDYFKILAVDTSVSVLLENGIEPDYIVAVDAQIYNLYDFLKVKNKNTALFFDLTGYPGIPSILDGEIYYFLSNFADTRLLERLEKYKLLPKKIPALGSVGITAIYIAMEMTQKDIFITGLDFSYQIGKSHANGSPRHIAELVRTTRLEPLEQPEIYYARPLIHTKDKFGNECISDLILSSYANLKGSTFKQNERLKDIGVSGLYNGSKLIKTADLLLSKKCNHLSLDNKEISSFSTNNYHEFLKNEITLLNLLYSETFLYLSAKSKDSSGLLDILKDTDYVFLHFPDKSPEPNLESGFLKRILVSCRHYINLLERYNSVGD